MPESAEVRQQVETLRQLEGHTIKAAEVVSGRYIKTPIPGFNKLVGFRFDGFVCKGKLIVFLLTSPEGSMCPSIAALSTLGMTGWWVVIAGRQGDRAINLKHCRLRFETADYTLCFVDPRNFGTFKVTNKAGVVKKFNELGPDISAHQLAPSQLFERLERYAKKKTIAEAMLDQRIFCGVGNYIRADALYHARIDPRTPALELSRQQVGQLWSDAHMVANAAYFSNNYESPCYGQVADSAGNPIESYEDRNGRTVWWCPAMQERRK